MKKVIVFLLLLVCFFSQSFAQQDIKVCSTLTALKAYARTTAVTAVDLLGYNAPGDGGGGRFVWIGSALPATTPAPVTGSIFVTGPASAGTGYWRRDVNDGIINVVWFGVKATTLAAATATVRTANNTGIVNTIDAAFFLENNTSTVSGAGSKNTYKIYVPGNLNPYYFSGPITLNRALEFFGDNNYYGSHTEIRVPLNFSGLVITSAPNFVHTVKVHDLSIVYSDLVNFAGYPTANPNIHGIDASAIVELDNVKVYGFPGDGFHLFSDKTINPNTDVSFSRIKNCKSQQNTGNGFFIKGPDANGCTIQDCDARANKNFGYYEASSFGNNYISADSHNNGPGSTGGSPTVGGGFHIEGGSNHSTFNGCYMEAADTRSENINAAPLFVSGSGLTAASFDATTPVGRIYSLTPTEMQISPGLVIRGEANDAQQLTTGYEAYNIIAKPTIKMATGAQRGLGINIVKEGALSNINYTLGVNPLGGGDPTVMSNYLVMFQRAQNASQVAFAVAKNTSNPDFLGRVSASSSEGKIMFPNGIFLKAFTTQGIFTNPTPGPFNSQHRLFAMSERIPILTPINVAGFDGQEYAKGDFLLNNNPLTANIIGWRCVTSGTPGTWQQLNAAGFNTVQNGLTITGTNLELGGAPLLHNTAIDLSTFNLDLTVAGNSKITFNNDANAGAVISLNGTHFIHSNGTANTFMGQNSGNFSNTGSYNTGLGIFSQNATTTAFGNTSVGANSLWHNTTGSINTAIGWNTLVSNDGGQENVAVGGEALLSNSTGSLNVAVGRSTLVNNTTGFSNVAVGQAALLNNVNGNLNVAIGNYSGSVPTLGNFNVYIGTNATPVSATNADNKLYINSASLSSNTPLIGGDFGSRKVSINKDITTPLAYTLDVNGTGRYSNGVIMGTTSYPDANFATAQSLNYNLLVKGKVLTEGVDILLFSSWPDYVFEKNYALPSLINVAKYIRKNKHLPGMIAADEMQKKKVLSVGDMTVKLVEKIEELTLYAIDADKNLEQANKKINSLELRLQALEKKIDEKNN